MTKRGYQAPSMLGGSLHPDEVKPLGERQMLNGKQDLLPTVTLQQVEMFRTVYALCDISPVTKRLRATHYAVCLQHGRVPTWGVFNAQTGRMAFLYESRYAVEFHHRNKAWRIRQAAFTMGRVEAPWDHEQRQKHLRKQTSRRGRK